MKKFTSTFFGISLLAIVLAFVLNPSADKHREKIKQAVAERSQIEGFLGVGHLKAFAAKYKSVGVASYTTIDNELASFGILGVVFVLE